MVSVLSAVFFVKTSSVFVHSDVSVIRKEINKRKVYRVRIL